MTAGENPNVASGDYHKLGAVNASLLNVMVNECPAAAWHRSYLNPEREREPSTPTQERGTIRHAALLQPERLGEMVAILNRADYPNKGTGEIPAGFTNPAIRGARDHARAEGKAVMLAEEWAEVAAQRDAALAYIESLREDEPAIWAMFQPGGGDSELTITWDDAGTHCRIRPDRINTERTLIVDYKTGDTTAEPNTWGRVQLVRMGYYVDAAFYRRGVRALTGKSCEYVFLVQESSPPYLCSLVGMDEQAFNLGAAKIEHGLNLWRRCERSGRWPAYPPRVCYPSIPAWEHARWEEQEALGIPYDPEKLWGTSRGAPASENA